MKDHEHKFGHSLSIIANSCKQRGGVFHRMSITTSIDSSVHAIIDVPRYFDIISQPDEVNTFGS